MMATIKIRKEGNKVGGNIMMEYTKEHRLLTAKHRTMMVNGVKERGSPTTTAADSNKVGRGASQHNTGIRKEGDSIRTNHSGRVIGKDRLNSRPHHHLKAIGGKIDEDNRSGGGQEMTPR